MCLIHSFTIPVRILIGLWAGIVFFGGIAYAQEKNIDTLHIFNSKIDTVRLSFEDILQLSSLYDSADKDDWRYIYRWNTGEKTEAVQVKFEGKRKLLYIGQRFSAIHWPEEYDTFFASKKKIWYATDPEEDTCIVCAPTIDTDTGQYVWHNNAFSNGELIVLGKGQCIYATPELTLGIRPSQFWLYCSPKVISSIDEGLTDPSLHLDFDTISGIKQRMQGAAQWHEMNVWEMPRGTQIYARLRDTLHFFSESNHSLYPEQEGHEILGPDWSVYPENLNRVNILDSTIDVYFKDSLFLRKLDCSVRHADMNFWENPIVTYHYLYFGIKPNAKIESDSIWVFFPQYPYSNLGGRVDICWLPDAPLPAVSDTVYTFNLGPWNRELEYVEYAWLDGTKTSSGGDSIVGRDSAFAYLFGRMDSVSPELYTGMLVTLVASDSLWQDSCECYIPCTDDACHRYDTVRIYLHLLPSLRENVFLPRDNVLCAHLDLELRLPEEAADEYHAFWLDRDSVALPYGYDTARYTVQGMRGLDGYGAETDTREPRFFQLRLDHKLCEVSYFDTLLVYDQVKPHFELLCHDTLICLDEPVEMDSLSPQVYHPFYVFEWNDGTKGSGYTFTDSGVYVLQFFVGKDFAVCGYDTVSDTIRVRWSDPAQTLITLGDTSFCEKLSVVLDASVPCPTTLYCWQDGPIPDPEEEFGDETDSLVFSSVSVKVIKEEGTYNISLFDTMGCVNRKEISVTMEDCSPKLEIPNVFTPNGDGVNDVWKFKQLEKCVDVKVEVVDRWGQPVLKTKVATADDFEWNGTVNNNGRRLPDGPYFYMVTYKDVYDKSKVQSGSITILGTSE